MDVICPLDDTPCTKDCPDRYKDRAEGGCLLTTSLAAGCHVLSDNPNGQLFFLFPDGRRVQLR